MRSPLEELLLYVESVLKSQRGQLAKLVSGKGWQARHHASNPEWLARRRNLKERAIAKWEAWAVALRAVIADRGAK